MCLNGRDSRKITTYNNCIINVKRQKYKSMSSSANKKSIIICTQMKAKLSDGGVKFVKPITRSLFEAVKSTMKTAHMTWLMNKT